jgi:hypothetical protein
MDIIPNRSIKFRDIVPTRIKYNKIEFAKDQYINIPTDKKQICWHHTASGQGVRGDISHFANDPSRIATPIIVGAGEINSLFSSKYWAHHLGIKMKYFKKYLTDTEYDHLSNSRIQNRLLNERCIGIEIDNWGPVRLGADGQFYTWTNKYGLGDNPRRNTIIGDDRIIEFSDKYKNKQYYEKYNEADLEASMYLSAYWCLFYGINPSLPSCKNEFYNHMHEVNIDALGGKNGIYSHTSYRPDKYDLSPQPIVQEYMCGIEDIVKKFL